MDWTGRMKHKNKEVNKMHLFIILMYLVYTKYIYGSTSYIYIIYNVRAYEAKLFVRRILHLIGQCYRPKNLLQCIKEFYSTLLYLLAYKLIGCYKCDV